MRTAFPVLALAALVALLVAAPPRRGLCVPVAPARGDAGCRVRSCPETPWTTGAIPVRRLAP